MEDLFPDVGPVRFEGPGSKNPLAFRFYDAEETFGDKTMKEHLRFALSWWHTVTAEGAGMFARHLATPQDGIAVPAHSCRRAEGPSEMTKLGIAFLLPTGIWCPRIFLRVESAAGRHGGGAPGSDEGHGDPAPLNTSNLFSHPRYVHGAATSCNPEVFASRRRRRKIFWKSPNRGGGFVFWGREWRRCSTPIWPWNRQYGPVFHLALDTPDRSASRAISHRTEAQGAHEAPV